MKLGHMLPVYVFEHFENDTLTVLEMPPRYYLHSWQLGHVFWAFIRLLLSPLQILHGTGEE